MAGGVALRREREWKSAKETRMNLSMGSPRRARLDETGWSRRVMACSPVGLDRDGLDLDEAEDGWCLGGREGRGGCRTRWSH